MLWAILMTLVLESSSSGAVVLNCATTKPDCDGVGEDALNCTLIEAAEDLAWSRFLHQVGGYVVMWDQVRSSSMWTLRNLNVLTLSAFKHCGKVVHRFMKETLFWLFPPECKARNTYWVEPAFSDQWQWPKCLKGLLKSWCVFGSPEDCVGHHGENHSFTNNLWIFISLCHLSPSQAGKVGGFPLSHLLFH